MRLILLELLYLKYSYFFLLVGKMQRTLAEINQNSLGSGSQNNEEVPQEDEFLEEDSPAQDGSLYVISNETFASSINSIEEKLLNAEIHASLFGIENNFSREAIEDFGQLAKTIASDSEVGKQFLFTPKKFAYICAFGFAPHFRKVLANSFSQSEYYTLLFYDIFDENISERITDVHVRFWDQDLNQIHTRYYTSLFMDTRTSENRLDAFFNATNDIEQNKILQISVDCDEWLAVPEFYELFKRIIVKNYGCNVLHIGKFSLQMIHGAFMLAGEESDWNISEFLQALHSTFCWEAIQNVNYPHLENSELGKLPIEYRPWKIEDRIDCCECALEILPELKRYIEMIKSGECEDYLFYFEEFDKATNDPLITAKISFYMSVAKLVQTFLSLYGSDKPLLPFLASDILVLIQECLAVIQSGSNSTPSIDNIYQFDCENNQKLMAVNSVHATVSSAALLDELKKENSIPEEQERRFKRDCRKFIVSMVQEIIRVCPIKHTIVSSLVCLDPRIMADEKRCLEKVQDLLKELAACERISDSERENLFNEFVSFLNAEVKCRREEFLHYDVKEDRLDTFLSRHMNKDRYTNLWRMVKGLLTLSYQCIMEYKPTEEVNFEIENEKTFSYASYKTIREHIKFCRENNLEVEITEELINSVSDAKQKFCESERPVVEKPPCKRRKTENEK